MNRIWLGGKAGPEDDSEVRRPAQFVLMKTRARERGHSSRLRGSESRCMAAMAVLGPRRKHAAVGTRTPVRKQTMQTTEKIKTHNLGYPRIGEGRELKRATEAFWNGTLTEAELLAHAAELRGHHWQKQQALGIDLIPSNDFSLYDQMGDAAALVGCGPKRFSWSDASVDLTTYFKMARGEVAKHDREHSESMAAAL